MPTWLPPTTAHQPDITLTSWSALEVLIPRLGKPTLHVAGWASDEQSGRVSSPVVSVDASQRCVVTRSGRAYRLDGEPGSHPDAQYVLEAWLEGFKAEVLADATEDVLKQLALRVNARKKQVRKRAR